MNKRQPHNALLGKMKAERSLFSLFRRLIGAWGDTDVCCTPVAQSRLHTVACTQPATWLPNACGRASATSKCTNPQRPSNRGVNADGKAWQGGAPQGHRPNPGPFPGVDAAIGAGPAVHEGHSAKGEATCRAGSVSPTITTDKLEIFRSILRTAPVKEGEVA